MAENEAYLAAEEKIERAICSKTQHLDLSVNWTADADPLTVVPESISDLPWLKSLNLSGNHLVNLPDSISRLTQLKTLNVTRCMLSDLPNWLIEMPNLVSLELGSNRFGELPDELGRMVQLQSLNLSSVFAKLPESLGNLENLHLLEIDHNSLTRLPDWIRKLTGLQSLAVNHNIIEDVPDWIGELSGLEFLVLAGNRISQLPASIGNLICLQSLDLFTNRFDHIPEGVFLLKNLEKLSISHNRIHSISDDIGELKRLRELYAAENLFERLPRSIGNLVELRTLILGGKQLSSGWTRQPEMGGSLSELPLEIVNLPSLYDLNLDGNPLNPELAAAYDEGMEAVKRYLIAKADAQVSLNEAKLILVGEGEVGKSCLLGALRGDPWMDDRPTTHGIEIKPVKIVRGGGRAELTLNGWDFGGQRVYRPTHQLFFSSPAVYLVVWKPREGPQQGFVREWIKLIKYREPDAKILVVATHGGPGERQPDIDRQELWDLFGRDTIVDFFSVDSKAVEGGCVGVEALKAAIADIAESLPDMERNVPTSWHNARTELKMLDDAYISTEVALGVCEKHQMSAKDANLFLAIEHRIGHLIHYANDSVLRDIVVLKPDWLATAISLVLDDKITREAHGLVSFQRLSSLWNDENRVEELRYREDLHPVFLRLMERYDLSYKVANIGDPDSSQCAHLIAQLVPDVRPSEVGGWGPVSDGEEELVQICHIVESKSGQSANAEGLFYQLIVRLHKFSLGRLDYTQSSHWQRGLVLDNDYNGKALLEHVGNDVRITVRAAYPEAFLSILTHEVKWLVESFWRGMRCDVMVPCQDPCGRGAPGLGLFEVGKLIDSKKKRRPEYPCSICNEWQHIDGLLRNAPAARPSVAAELQAGYGHFMKELNGVRKMLVEHHGVAMQQFLGLNVVTLRLLSKVDDAFSGIMSVLTDEAKDGPRLFSMEPADSGFFDKPKWISQKFTVTLWCEHSRLPLWALDGDEKKGVYEMNIPRYWFVQIAPFLKVLGATLSLALPVASTAAEVLLSDEVFERIGSNLEAGQRSIEILAKSGDQIREWSSSDVSLEKAPHGLQRAEGPALRQLHSWLKERDPSFGGMVRVQNKRQEFVWVHPRFREEY